MSARLTHSPAAYLRSMQSSRRNLWIVVEGWLDRGLYGRVCEAHSNLGAGTYCIVTAAEIGGHSGGKERLLRFYRYLRQRSSLVSTLGGKKTAALFFLDKDLDDVLKRKTRSPHVVYTEMHSAENYLYRYGDLRRAAADSAMLDRESIDAVVPEDAYVWCRGAAEKWQEWVVYCYFLLKWDIGAEGYSAPSKFNDGARTPTNMAKVKRAIRAIRPRLLMSVKEFRRARKAAMRYVQGKYDAGLSDALFKGKWYGYFLGADIDEAARGRSYDRNGVTSGIQPSLLGSMNCGDAWASRYHAAITFCLAMLE